MTVTNMAEEVHNPAVEVPRAIAWSIPIGTISGFMFLLPISFTLPDIATLLAGELMLSKLPSRNTFLKL